MPDSQITVLGASDVSDMLDAHPNLRRSFPQLLGLRDLNALLREAVNAEILERSRSAIDAASELIGTFAPTSSYDKAWSVLHAHSFAVLEGPPEMGKTAIAWMISLALLSQGWEAIVCDRPVDFFKSYEREQKQIFVADDAFGRTEYDPARGSEWERDLDRVLQRLNRRHWLVWTSRKHILERALHRIDLQGKAATFPNPAAVLVNAAHLSPTERALILYRHLKARKFLPSFRRLLQQTLTSQGRRVVLNRHFTPERIRRFVQITSGELEGLSERGSLTQHALLDALVTALTQPTDRMRKAFAVLEPQYKWCLVSLLEAGAHATIGQLMELYEAHCPSEGNEAFTRMLEELTEAFVRLSGPANQMIEWIHPSYRDLVIEELSNDKSVRREFLSSASTKGIALALSRGGGPEGARDYPFLSDSEDWAVLQTRCVRTIEESDKSGVIELLQILKVAQEDKGEVQARIVAIVKDVCTAARNKWDREQAQLGPRLLREYYDATIVVDVLVPSPALGPSWTAAVHRLDLAVDGTVSDIDDLASALEAFTELVEVIKANEPRWLRQANFPDDYREVLDRARELIESMLDIDPLDLDKDQTKFEWDRVESVTASVGRLRDVGGFGHQGRDDLHERLTYQAEALRDHLDEHEGPEPDYDEDRRGEPGDEVGSIFSDL